MIPRNDDRPFPTSPDLVTFEKRYRVSANRFSARLDRARVNRFYPRCNRVNKVPRIFPRMCYEGTTTLSSDGGTQREEEIEVVMRGPREIESINGTRTMEK